MRRLAMALCLGGAAQVAAVGARAETRALLVGVSDYDAEGGGIADLRGPANDVRLLRDVLKAQGVRRIDSLADGAEGAGRPSRTAILAVLAGLAAASGKGDLVYLHFSGHGTRQIDRNGDETDGLDEVFLAIDAGPGAPGSGLIANAATDDEIGSAVAAIRAAGADVWVVLDFRNSGTGLRGVLPGIAARYADPAAFGIDAPPDGVPEAGDEIPAGEGLPGGYPAFYAARSSEIAHEVNLAGAEGGNAWYGLFTAKLAARLQGVPAMSCRQLFQAVLADFNDESLPGPARP
ncbi:caspase family protein [Albidovulum sp.]|uniref:caspase family protein n=1 Tax=Albidovulum sp. TaxID=1872424 RepID=UPI0039B92E81